MTIAVCLKRLCVPFALSGSVLLAGCAAPATQEETVSDLGAIDEVREAFEAAVAGADYAAFGGLVHPEAVFVQPATPEWDAMRRAAAGAPFPQGAVMEITPLETRILSEEWAYDFGATRITYPDPETGEEMELRDTFLLILRNEGSGWKPYREVASTGAPPSGWPSAMTGEGE